MPDEPASPPAFVSLREAAKRTGLAKATIARKIKNGEISVREKRADGSYCIDASELLRFMDASRVQRATGSGETLRTPPEPPETPPSIELLAERHAREIAETQLTGLKALVDELRTDRDQWRETATATLRLLPGPPRRGLWARLRRAG